LKAVGLLLIALLAFTACNTDYEVPLPNKYVLGRISPGEFVVVAPDHRHILVGPTVYEYAVVGAIITGHVRAPGGATSYFIIDTDKAALAERLGRDSWNRELAACGVRDVRLVPPSRPARRYGVLDLFRR